MISFLPPICSWTAILRMSGKSQHPGPPISVIFGQPLGPKIGQNPYLTSSSINRACKWPSNMVVEL
jgi:hypothetical protein